MPVEAVAGESGEERFDVLDADGHPLGYSKPRSHVHRDGDWHRSVQIWLVKQDGRCIMQQRCARKDSNPLKWDIACAGHVSTGEASLPTAMRELEEELGVRVGADRLELVHTFKYHAVLQEGRFIDNEHTDVYLVRLGADELADVHADFALQESEVAAVRYIPWRQVRERLAAHDPDYVQYEPAWLAPLWRVLDEWTAA